MPRPVPIKELKSRAAKAKKELAASGRHVNTMRKAMLESPDDKDSAAGYRGATASDIAAARNLKMLNEWVAKREAA